MSKKKLPADISELQAHKPIATINGVTHYDSGFYESLSRPDADAPGSIGYGGYVSNFSWVLSDEYNRLKAKLFNAIEASALDDRQAAAFKGLVKGFCNDSYIAANDGMSKFMSDLGFGPALEKLNASQGLADPLGSRETSA